jgi:hypothetical protein
MPDDGFLLADALESGRTMLFDLREPQHPSLVTSFGDLDDTGIRTPTCDWPTAMVSRPSSTTAATKLKSDGGGLVEFDERGQLVRSSSAIDPAAKGELIRPYSLVVVPALDRIVSTNTSMHFKSDGENSDRPGVAPL